MLQREFAGEADGLGDVVEVVSDAAGEAAYGFHAMGVAEFLFQLALAGDVQSIALDVLVPGLGVRAEISGEGDTNDAAILLAEAGFEIANLAGGEELGEKAVAVAGFDIEAGDADGGKLLESVAEASRARDWRAQSAKW